MGLCPGFCCLKVPSTRAQVLSYRKNIRAIREVLSGKRDSLIARMHKAGHDVGPVIRVFQNAQINARHQAIANSQDGALAQLAAQFGLAGPPQRIEGYDIAHIQDRHATGAMVVFTNGRYDKAQSRLFNIKEDLQGDVPMLRHVIQRRLTHPEWPGPDLVLVDGGLAQLNLAAKLFKNIPVIALTKDERHQGDHVLSSLDRKVRPLAALPRPIRDLLVQIDNEAHRRAIGQYRRLHRRSIA